MFYNFFKPQMAFEEAIANPNPKKAILVALVSSIIFGLSAYLTTDFFIALGVTISFFMQWLVFTGVLYIFEFMTKNRKKKRTSKKFNEIISATGTFWQITILIGILVFITIILSNSLLLLLLGMILFLLGLLYFYNLYALVKVVLDLKQFSAIISIILILILNSMLMTLTMSLLRIVI